MPTCKQQVELFLSEEQWNKADVHEQYEKDYVKLIMSNTEGDFDIDLKKNIVELGFGFFKVKIPRDAFLVEVGRALLDECCGGEFTTWLMKQNKNH